MKNPFSIPATITAYATAMLLFAWLCPGDELMTGLGFQLVTLWLASEAWNSVFVIHLFLLAAKANKEKREDTTNPRKLAKLTSPVLLVVPPLLHLVFWLVDSQMDGRLGGEFGFSDLGGLFKASYGSVVWFFLCCLFSRVIPVSVRKMTEPEYNPDPLETGMSDTPSPQGLPAQAAARGFHSKRYTDNEAAMRKMLQDGEEIVFSTAPDAGLLLRLSGTSRRLPLVGTVFLLVGLAGLVSFFMVQQGGMKVFCAAAAVLGLIMAFGIRRAYATEKRRYENCDFFLTTERFCRLNTVDKPKSVFWKDKPRHHATYLPGSDVGNIHINPTHGFFSKMITAIAGEPQKEVSRTQGELAGMECIHDCAAVYEIVQRLAGEYCSGK